MKTITISSLLEAEMLMAAKTSGTFSPAVRAEIISLLAPSTVVPPPPVAPPITGDWKAAALAASVAAGYDRAILYEWDWAASVSRLDTVNMGLLGQRGVLIVRFLPTGPADNVLGQISAVGYPANSTASDLYLSIAHAPLGAALSAGSDAGPSPTVRYVIGQAPTIFGQPSAASFTPGVPCYISVAGRDLPEGGANYDIRLSLGKPAGH